MKGQDKRRRCTEKGKKGPRKGQRAEEPEEKEKIPDRYRELHEGGAQCFLTEGTVGLPGMMNVPQILKAQTTWASNSTGDSA